jgi:hypothetical protein
VKGIWPPWTGIHCKHLAPRQLILVCRYAAGLYTDRVTCNNSPEGSFCEAGEPGSASARLDLGNANQLLFSAPVLTASITTSAR